MHFDPVLLSRIQFAWVAGWHILLPAFTVGLASFTAFLEGAHADEAPDLSGSLPILVADLRDFLCICHLYAFSVRHELEPFLRRRRQCDIPLLAYEGLTEFFLEATFLGVLLAVVG